MAMWTTSIVAILLEMQMGRSRPIPTDESLAEVLYLSDSHMQPCWCVDLAGNVSHVSVMNHLDRRPARFADGLLTMLCFFGRPQPTSS